MDTDFQEQRRRFQQNLIDFLNAHLDLGFTFCRTAQLDTESENTRDKALVALNTVRKFEGRIADPALWTKIHVRADQLEKLISTL